MTAGTRLLICVLSCNPEVSYTREAPPSADKAAQTDDLPSGASVASREAELHSAAATLQADGQGQHAIVLLGMVLCNIITSPTEPLFR